LNALLQHPRQDQSPDLRPSKKPKLDGASEKSDERDDDNHLFSRFLLDEIPSKENEPLEREFENAKEEVAAAANSNPRTPHSKDAERRCDDAAKAFEDAMKALENGRKHSEETTQKLAATFLNQGSVFFNHWILLNHPVRPSTLIKAWTRCAALVCRPNTVGIDFVIPVMMKASNPNDENQFGPLFGDWTPEQEAVADKFVSYILIQTKNRSGNLRARDINSILEGCIPMTTDGTTATVVSFELHTAQNPYVSILMNFGWPSESAVGIERVEFVPTRSVTEVGKQEAEVMEERKKEQKARKEQKDMEEKRRQEGDTDLVAKTKKRTTNLSDLLVNNIRERSKQIAIAVYGLDEYGYKCLENRDSWKDYLGQFKLDTTDPWKELGEQFGEESVPVKLLQSGMHVTMNPKLEDDLWV
jgi:hypothetical protein